MCDGGKLTSAGKNTIIGEIWMNSTDLRRFREIFEKQMNQDGFVWKHHMFIHICFEQGWYATVHPWVVSYGDEFKTVCAVGLLVNLTAEELKLYHHAQEPSIGRYFDVFTNLPKELQFDVHRSSTEPPEHYETLPVSNVFFQYTLKRYAESVRPIFHEITNIHDVFLFERQYEVIPWPSLYDIMMLDALMSAGYIIDALSYIPILRTKTNEKIDMYIKYKKEAIQKLEELKQYENTMNEKLRQVQIHGQQIVLKGCIESIKNSQIYLQQLNKLEQMISAGTYQERINTYQERVSIAVANHMKCFSKKEKSIMIENWHN